jgi:zinc transporter 5/7
MQGIFLHILADALGSFAVIISTLMTKWDGWSGWDPIGSCAIAVMIFLSAIPLVKSSGMKLLLALPSETEYVCRDILQGVSELRGISGYAGVRFWLGDKTGDEDGQILGVVHVIATTVADLEDVRERTALYLRGRGVDAVVHVEREGDTKCWCRGGRG